MVNPARHFDIAIVGGGLNGAALALALKDSPYRVALIEPRPPQAPVDDDGWDARIFAFSPGNVAWLDGLGGWRDPVRAQPVHAMRITGDGGASLHFDGLDAGLGELAFIAENGRLQAALWQALPDNVSVVTAALDAVQWGASRHRLRLADGSEIEADLLVAADGADSWLRRQAGIALDVEDYHHVGVVANFACEKAHRGTAFQWFDGASVLAYLPLPGRRISVVWSSPSDLAPARLALSPEALALAVAAAGQHTLGRLDPLGRAAGFPLIRRRAQEWVRPGLVLLGDAAHTVHPLAGQGVNLGFRDGRLLAETLAGGGDPGEIGRLQSYAARRMEDVATMQFTTGGLKKLFNHPSPALAWLRNTGLDLTERQDWLKQALMRHAMQ